MAAYLMDAGSQSGGCNGTTTTDKSPSLKIHTTVFTMWCICSCCEIVKLKLMLLINIMGKLIFPGSAKDALQLLNS